MNVNTHVRVITNHLMRSLVKSPLVIQKRYLNRPNIEKMVRPYVLGEDGCGYLYASKSDEVIAGLLHEKQEGRYRRRVYIKYYFCVQEFRRTGVTAKLVEAALRFARNNDLGDVTACVQDWNIPSWMLLKRCGFKVYEDEYVKLLDDGKDSKWTRSYGRNQLIDEAAIRGMRDIIESKVVEKAGNAVEIGYEMKRVDRLLDHIVEGNKVYPAYHRVVDGVVRSIAITEVFHSRFKDYLNVHYVYSADNSYDDVFDAIEDMAKASGLGEICIAIGSDDVELRQVLLSKGYVLCERTYMLSGMGVNR